MSAESFAVIVPPVVNNVFVLCDILCAVSVMSYVFEPEFLAASIISAWWTVDEPEHEIFAASSLTARDAFAIFVAVSFKLYTTALLNPDKITAWVTSAFPSTVLVPACSNDVLSAVIPAAIFAAVSKTLNV